MDHVTQLILDISDEMGMDIDVNRIEDMLLMEGYSVTTDLVVEVLIENNIISSEEDLY